MVALSISVEASCGLAWPLRKDLVAEFERLGFAGIEELMAQWFCLDDFEGLRFLAEHVAPYV